MVQPWVATTAGQQYPPDLCRESGQEDRPELAVLGHARCKLGGSGEHGSKPAGSADRPGQQGGGEGDEERGAVLF